MIRRRAAQAHRRAPAPARPALAAPRRRVRDDARADERVVAAVADRDDRARPLVAEDGAGARVLLEHEVEIGAADAAVRHLDECLARRRCGNGSLLDRDLPLARVHRNRHQHGRICPSVGRPAAGGVRRSSSGQHGRISASWSDLPRSGRPAAGGVRRSSSGIMVGSAARWAASHGRSSSGRPRVGTGDRVRGSSIVNVLPSNRRVRRQRAATRLSVTGREVAPSMVETVTGCLMTNTVPTSGWTSRGSDSVRQLGGTGPNV